MGPSSQYASCLTRVNVVPSLGTLYITKMHCFFILDLRMFYIVFSTICRTSMKTVEGTRAPFFRFFGEVKNGPPALLRIKEPRFGRTSVLSVSVVFFVSVESAMECRMRVNDVFCAVSLGGTMRSLRITVLCYSTNRLLAATQPFTLRTQALILFSSIQWLRVPVA